jgi:hypothetical protein
MVEGRGLSSNLLYPVIKSAGCGLRVLCHKARRIVGYFARQKPKRTDRARQHRTCFPVQKNTPDGGVGGCRAAREKASDDAREHIAGP